MTVELIENEDRYAGILRRLFYEDKELIETYHVFAGQGLKNCVNKTVSDMKDFVNYAFYVIKDRGNIIAFFGREVVDGYTFMTGFFIKMNYRTHEFVKFFWDSVRKTLGAKEAYSSVYKKNTRAINFLCKKGCVAFEKNDIVTFKIF